MTMLDATDYEADVTKLKARISELENKAVSQRAAGDALRSKMRESGVDLTSLDERDAEAFANIQAEYRAGDEAKQQADELRKRLQEVYGWTGHAGHGKPLGMPGETREETRKRMQLGRRFVESDGYARARALMTQEGVRVNDVGIMTLERAELIENLRTRAGLDLGSGQSLVPPDVQVFPPVELPVRKLRLLDLINVETTDSDVVYWNLQTTRTLAAAPTASGTNAPMATLAFAKQTSNVQRIPVVLSAHKEVLADQTRAQSILDRQLMDDVRLTLEAQCLNGNGTAPNLPGILTTGGLQSYARATAAPSDYNLDALHKAITKVRLSLFDEPDGIGVHPNNSEGVVLQRDNYGRYIFEPSADQERVWGFPLISTPLFTAGTGLVGQFKTGATLWIRDGVAVTMTDGYYDNATSTNYFSAGMVAILAQLRAAFAVERVFAFCQVTGLI